MPKDGLNKVVYVRADEAFKRRLRRFVDWYNERRGKRGMTYSISDVVRIELNRAMTKAGFPVENDAGRDEAVEGSGRGVEGEGDAG